MNDHSRKRLLMLSNSLPVPPTNGSAMRVRAMLRCLADEGYRVELMCFGNAADSIRSREMDSAVCAGVELIPHDSISLSGRTDVFGRLRALLARQPYSAARSRSTLMQRRITERLAGGDFDAVLCEETNLLINLPDKLDIPLIVDHQNVEFLLIQRYVEHSGSFARGVYARLEAANTRRWERNACIRAQLVLACSAHDVRVFQSLHHGSPVIVAPNVIDVASYCPTPEGEPGTVLYTGGMDWYPNRDAVTYFVEQVFPLVRQQAPGVRFVVAGRNPSNEFRQQFTGMPDVVFTGTVADMRDEIAKASVCVVPLRIGSGTRLKILEAAAIGKPIVSTSLGAEGLDFGDGSEILIADDAGSFAAATASLLVDPRRRAQLGRAAREKVENQYSLAALSTALRTAFTKVQALAASATATSYAIPGR
jgi:glycosyltransferase involved in cell wall biosynthesis